MKESDWDEVLDTNLKGTYLMTKAVIRPMFKAKWGRIVNIASVAGQYGNPGQVNYSASKAGIIGFTKAVAREFAERGITVNAVSPGLIDTEMSRALPEKARTGHHLPDSRGQDGDRPGSGRYGEFPWFRSGPTILRARLSE